MKNIKYKKNVKFQKITRNEINSPLNFQKLM